MCILWWFVASQDPEVLRAVQRKVKLSSLTTEEAQSAVAGIDIHKTNFINNAIDNANLAKKTLNVSTIVFWLTCIVISIFTFIKKYSLIPLLGLVTCLYLLTGMTAKNWAWFSSWLVLGLMVYFLYGYKKSKLAGEADKLKG